MDNDTVQTVLSALDQKEEATKFLVESIKTHVAHLEKLGVAKADIAIQTGIVAVKGRKKGSKNKKPTTPQTQPAA